MYRLRTSRHADIRIEERVDLPAKARREIRRKLFGMMCGIGLKRGDTLAPNLDAYIRFGDGYTAICRMNDLRGGWVIATVLTPDMAPAEAAVAVGAMERRDEAGKKLGIHLREGLEAK